MNMIELNTYNYNHNFFSCVADGDDYLGLATSVQHLTSQERRGNLLENIPQGTIHTAYTFDLAKRLPVGSEEYIQLADSCQELYVVELDNTGSVVVEKGRAETYSNALSGEDLTTLPAAVFDRESGRFNIPELKLWMEAAQFLLDQAGSDWSTIAKRAAAQGIKLDYVVAE